MRVLHLTETDVFQLMRPALLSPASDILQTTTSQRPRAVRGQTDAQQGQDFAALVESNASADKAAQQPSTDQSERRTEDSRASQADRSNNAQTENAQNRREQARQARAARDRDDRNVDAAARRDAAQEAAHEAGNEAGTQAADRSAKNNAGQNATQARAKANVDEAATADSKVDSNIDQIADQTADTNAAQLAPEVPSPVAIALALNPDIALSGIDNSGAESDAAIADALNAKSNATSADQQADFAQLANAAAAQDDAIADDAAQNGAPSDQTDQAATGTTDSSAEADPSAEAAVKDGDETAHAAKAAAQDAIARAAVDTATRRDAKAAQAELQANAANRTTNNEDAKAPGEQKAATGKQGQTDAAQIANTNAASVARAGRGHSENAVTRAERAARSETAIKADGASSTDTETALASDSAKGAKSIDATDATATASAAKAGAANLAAERFDAANHALALQAALADSVAGQAQSSFANPASVHALQGGLHQPILQNVALFDVQSTGQIGNQASGQAIAVSGLATEIVARSRDGSNRFEIRLDPAELGRIDVRLDVDKHGNVSSRLIVERSETLDLLRRDAAGLERALQDAGLKTSDNGLQFSLRDQNAGRQQDDQSQNQRHARLIISDEDNLAAAPAGQTYGRMLGNAGGLDIRV